MADDIIPLRHSYALSMVERITELEAEIERLRDELAAWQATVRAHDALAAERADEIERLREIAEAAEQYHDVACDPDWCRLCRALNAWLEARRG